MESLNCLDDASAPGNLNQLHEILKISFSFEMCPLLREQHHQFLSTMPAPILTQIDQFLKAKGSTSRKPEIQYFPLHLLWVKTLNLARRSLPQRQSLKPSAKPHGVQ